MRTFYIFFTVLPQDGPKIFGGRLTYKIGDTVNVNCSSGRSKPAAKLSWMLNGKPADANYLKYYNNSTSDADSLETTVLGLNFLVTANSFVNGEMKLKVMQIKYKIKIDHFFMVTILN